MQTIWQSPEIKKRRQVAFTYQQSRTCRYLLFLYILCGLITYMELYYGTILVFVSPNTPSYIELCHSYFCKILLAYILLNFFVVLRRYYRISLHDSSQDNKCSQKQNEIKSKLQGADHKRASTMYLPSCQKTKWLQDSLYNRSNVPTPSYHDNASYFSTDRSLFKNRSFHSMSFIDPVSHSSPSRPNDPNDSWKSVPGNLDNNGSLLKSTSLQSSLSGNCINFNLSDFLPLGHSYDSQEHRHSRSLLSASFNSSRNDASGMFGSLDANSLSPWSQGLTAGSFHTSSHPYDPDFSSLQQYQYQVASPTPATLHSDPLWGTDAAGKTNVKNDPEIDAIEAWSEMNVTQDQIDAWIEKLRKWIHGTILDRVIKEINEVNSRLKEFGNDDLKIGVASISNLRQLANSKSQYLPSLSTLISFLDCTKEQEYLVHRLTELSKGGCLGDFNWNGGSSSSKWPWKQHLPNDCAIILHLFTTYMDTRLTPYTTNLDGRTFSQLHLVRAEKHETDSANSCLLWQTSIQPPHFKVNVAGKVYDFEKGRKNLFLAIVFFLYQIKMRDGQLRRINFGESGINILWIFD